ncbi:MULTISPECIES: hypothetical protein [Vibrio]|uniref:hypothetical protein n=1 Tax=Vibrio TaxID=662 RepID=UPI000A95169D|nr:MULTISPECIES: hypothetical protein [Vibrio]MDX5010276.1 hypothetical protein [Vibrio cholerae]WJG24293.1 hypothetical protein QSU95_17595 [Vibrio furnissii]
MKAHRLTAAESHELACRVSSLGAKQVLLLLRQLQEQSLKAQHNVQTPVQTPSLKH